MNRVAIGTCAGDGVCRIACGSGGNAGAGGRSTAAVDNGQPRNTAGDTGAGAAAEQQRSRPREK